MWRSWERGWFGTIRPQVRSLSLGPKFWPKAELFSTFGHFLCLFRRFAATFEKIAFLRPHHQMWTENSFFFVYSGAIFEKSNEQPPQIFPWRCCICLTASVQPWGALSQRRFWHSFLQSSPQVFLRILLLCRRRYWTFCVCRLAISANSCLPIS